MLLAGCIVGMQAGLPQFSMLGLGDIVIPGIFVAIMLRYDAEQGFRSRYFYRCAKSAAQVRPAPVCCLLLQAS